MSMLCVADWSHESFRVVVRAGWRVSGLRPIAAPFIAAAPAGARVRTRLRVSAADAAVLRAVGLHLGKAVSRAARKRALTAAASSRWAGAITRTSEDQLGLAERNLRAEAASLRARVRRIEARLAVPVGGRSGRVRGYASAAERYARTIRLKTLKARLGQADQRLAAGAVSVVRGGRALLRKRGNLTAAGLSEEQWRAQWEAARLFLTADGEKGKAQGNETLRWHPDEGWLEVKLPVPLAHLANRPFGRYRLSCAVEFTYRGTRSPPRRPPAPSGTTSAMIRRPGAGTWTRVGRPPRALPRRWRSCGRTRW
jgi:hypothetical protein